MIRLIREIIRFSGRHAGHIRLSFLFSFLKSVCMKAPYAAAIMLIGMLLDASAGVGACVATAAALLLFLALQALFASLSDRLQSTAGYDMMAEKRLELGAHLRRLPMGYFTEGNIGKISAILSSDMVFIEEHSMQVIGECVSDIFSQFILTAFMFMLHPLLGGVMLAFELAAVLVARPMRRDMLEDSGLRQAAVEGMAGAVLEYAEGMGVIKSYGLTGESADGVRGSFSAMTAANLNFENRLTPWNRALLIVYGAGTAALLSAAVWLHGRGALAGAAFISAALMAFGVFSSLRHYYQQGAQFTIMKSGMDRLKAVMDEQELPDAGSHVLAGTGGCALPAHTETGTETDKGGETEKAKDKETGKEIEFEHVTFSYGEEDVLKDISFSVRPGETLALAGASGSGKTTVASLLSRFWDVSGGEIRVRGIDVRALPMDALMGLVGMVFQKVYLFEDTVYNNIAMGRRDASREEVAEAAKKARCYDFIMKLPYGFDTHVGAGGATLSGGEAQRV
ncbi:MAG: ABC transporter ATP-binding protein/permease, partial [Clostridiales bacterium]|nr:ABC transporter ATP-binding protein/permease [Clostridiales bacterium]